MEPLFLVFTGPSKGAAIGLAALLVLPCLVNAGQAQTVTVLVRRPTRRTGLA